MPVQAPLGYFLSMKATDDGYPSVILGYKVGPYVVMMGSLEPHADVRGMFPREYYTGVTMTIRHTCQSDTWARGSVHSRVAMPWSLGHLDIASVTREVYQMRKIPISRVILKKIVENP